MSRVAEALRTQDYMATINKEGSIKMTAMNNFFQSVCQAQGQGNMMIETVEQEYDRLVEEKDAIENRADDDRDYRNEMEA